MSVPTRPTLSNGARRRLREFMVREGLDDVSEAIVLMVERAQSPHPSPAPQPPPADSFASLF